MNLKNHIQVALGYFIIAAILGVVLRSSYSIDIPVNYKYIVHTHSHIALLGWVYIGLSTLLFKLFLEKQELNIKYRRIFWFTQITLVGMLLSFPFQGYALFSIIFSTLFLFASYWFTWFFVKNVPSEIRQTNSFKCVKVALWYMVLSSLGPWALGAIMNTLGAESIWYRLSIYFYLHFQYNGWMILALLGLFLYVLEAHRILLPRKTFMQFFLGFNVGIVLTFFLSTLWIQPSLFFSIIGGLGAFLQLFALFVLVKYMMGIHTGFRNIFSRFQFKLIQTITLLLFMKISLQLLTGLPYFANLASTILNFTVGYLHLTFLGVVTLGLFLFLNYFGLLKISKTSLMLYIIGFVFTEVLIFYKGITVWLRLGIFNGYFEGLALGSLLILIGLVTMLKPKSG